jgi:hypothetical protein
MGGIDDEGLHVLDFNDDDDSDPIIIGPIHP